MSIYRIAELNIEIFPQTEYTINQLKDYEVSTKKMDFSVNIQKSDIDYEINVGDISDYGICESLAIYRKICKKILADYNGILFHSAAIKYKGKAYLFTAKSGTGKTTHIRLWKDLLGDRVAIINGDKPILRLRDDKIIVYGTPWQGKENYGSNINAPLGGIFLLNRGIENTVEKADTKTALKFMFAQTLRYQNKENVEKLLYFMEKIVLKIPIYTLHCNMDISSVKTSLSVID